MDSKNKKIIMVIPFTSGNDYKIEELGPAFVVSYARSKGYAIDIVAIDKENFQIDAIKKEQPDLIGISVYNETSMITWDFINQIKKQLPGVKICLGGYFPTYYYDEIMKSWKGIDYIIRGEGEIPFLQLINTLGTEHNIDNINGLVFRRDGVVIENTYNKDLLPLEDVPPPARDLLYNNKIKTASIFTSRGCTRNCSFCLSHDFWKKWRGREPKLVAEEINEIVEKTNIRRFIIQDNSFEDPGFDKKRMKEIAYYIKQIPKKLTFYTMMRAEAYKVLDTEIIEDLKEAGWASVLLGIEAGNEEDLKLFNKTATLDDNNKSITFFKKNGIRPYIGFINFNPYSTLKRLELNRQFLYENGYAMNVERFITWLDIYKGTKIFQKTMADGILIENKNSENFYSYNFIDPDIGKLHQFLKQRFDYGRRDMNMKNKNLADLYSFTRYVYHDLAHLRLFLKLSNNSSSDELIEKYELKFFTCFTELNELNNDWFAQVLALLNSGWDEFKANTIVDKYFSEEVQKKYVQQLKKMFLELYVFLNRIWPEYNIFKEKI